MTGRELHHNQHAYTWCTHCRKKTWATRKTARRMAKRNHPNDVLNAYPCPHQHAGWHYGHLQPGDRDTSRRTA